MVAQIPHFGSSFYKRLFAGLATQVFGAGEFWAVGQRKRPRRHVVRCPASQIEGVSRLSPPDQKFFCLFAFVLSKDNAETQ